MRYSFPFILLTVFAPSIALANCGSTDNHSTPLRVEAAPRRIAHNAIGSPRFMFGSGGDLEMIASISDGGVQGLHAFVSNDQGNSYLDKGLVTPPGTDTSARGENAPRFAMDHDELLYALWRQNLPDERLFVATHDWRTGKYTRPLPVRDRYAKGYAGFADLAVGPDDTVYVVWLDGREQNALSDSAAVYLARMRFGRSFDRNVRVAGSTCSCCRPAVAVGTDGTVYVAWRHNDHDMRDMAVAASHDGGRSFSPMHFVAHDGWRIHGCPESGPSILVDGKRLYIAWFTLGGDAKPRVLLSYSDDEGVTFAAPTTLSRRTLDANHPSLVAMKPKGVAVVFQARDAQTGNGWSHLVPYIVRVRDDGSVTDPVAITEPGADDATYPFAVSRDAQSLFIGYSLGNEAVMIRGREH